MAWGFMFVKYFAMQSPDPQKTTAVELSSTGQPRAAVPTWAVAVPTSPTSRISCARDPSARWRRRGPSGWRRLDGFDDSGVQSAHQPRHRRRCSVRS